MPTPTSAPTSLLRRTDGAIVVAGVAMGILLVGALWHIVSVGDAILWRERLQDGADSAAFEAAVWNARGMNLIVLLNIVMSAVMAILVVLNGLYMVLSAALAALHAAKVACLFAWLPTGISQALCAASLLGPSILTPAQNAVGRARQVAEEKVPTVIKGIQTAQKVVATVTPLIGVKEATLKTRVNHRMPSIGFSASLVPSVGRLERLGTGISLPVVAGSERTLCEKAGEFVPNEILSLMEEAGIDNRLPNIILTHFRDIAGKVTGALPALFCGGSTVGSLDAMLDMFRNVATDECAGVVEFGRMQDGRFNEEQREILAQEDAGREGTPQARAEERQTRETRLRAHQRYWRTEDEQDVFATQRCERELFDEQNSKLARDGSNMGYKPAAIWGDTANGDIFMRAWGFSDLTPSTVSRNDRGLQFVDDSEEHLVPIDPHTLGAAQAEMYWDPVDCDGSWGDCKAEASWKMRWKARLTRVHSFAEMARRAVVEIVVSDLMSKVNGAVSDATDGLEASVISAAGGDRERGGLLAKVQHFLHGNLWSNVYSRLPVDPIGWGTGRVEGTIREALAQEAYDGSQRRLIH